MAEIKDRVIDYLKISGITKQEFCKTTGISYANMVGNSLKSELGGEQISSIFMKYPNINPDWLILGRGEMLRKNGSEPPALPLKTLPLIPFEAIAGIPSIDNFGVAFSDCDQYVVPEFAARGVDFLIRVSGSSMYPKYSNGDLLACTIIHDILFFQWGKVYVIDSSQGVLVKRIFESQKQDCIQLVSDNREHYPPFDFPVSDIRTLALVSGVIRLE